MFLGPRRRTDLHRLVIGIKRAAVVSVVGLGLGTIYVPMSESMSEFTVELVLFQGVVAMTLLAGLANLGLFVLLVPFHYR
jgi:hypothetical protein